LSIKASNLSAHGSSWLHFELLKLLYCDLNADPDPAIPSSADPNPNPASKINAEFADPCGSESAALEKLCPLQIRRFLKEGEKQQ
jgi:hypothetical protein